MDKGLDARLDDLREQIAAHVGEYWRQQNEARPPFIPGETPIYYAGRVYDYRDMMAAVDASLDFYLTGGKYTQEFERKFAHLNERKYCALVNSGSSANLLAVSALTSRSLGGDRLLPGDEVITTAAAFPTTVAPIIQNGLVPVFVDVDLDGRYNINIDRMFKALSVKTRAVMIAHTLGMPANIDEITDFCTENNLYFISDCCDALGSDWRAHSIGHYGAVSTFSFYPAHQITTGEGGAICCDDPAISRAIMSFRDWGRACHCRPGHDNACKNRYGAHSTALPEGYDHKYVYDHLGYNLKATEFQASIGLSQLNKLDKNTFDRQVHWNYLRNGLNDLTKEYVLPMGSEYNTSPFAFALTIKRPDVKRRDVIAFLEKRKIQTRMLFAGNITKQPCFDTMRQFGTGYRVSGTLENTDTIMERTFFVGVYPGLTKEMLHYMAESLREAVRK